MPVSPVTTDVDALADLLWTAEERREPVAPIAVAASLSIDDAYAVQRRNTLRRVARGEQRIGHKVGLTSEAMQQQLGVDSPDFGVITDAMRVPTGGLLDVGALIAPKLEAEFAFVIGAALPPAPGFDALVAAVSHVAVAIEIIDSRIADWRITLADTVADNASSARIVVGPLVEARSALLERLPGTVVSLDRDEVQVATGPGSAVLGDPLRSLHWLATAIGQYDEAFQAGDVVLAGAVAASVPLTRATWRASAAGFQDAVVQVTSTEGNRS